MHQKSRPATPSSRGRLWVLLRKPLFGGANRLPRPPRWLLVGIKYPWPPHISQMAPERSPAPLHCSQQTRGICSLSVIYHLMLSIEPWERKAPMRMRSHRSPDCLGILWAGHYPATFAVFQPASAFLWPTVESSHSRSDHLMDAISVHITQRFCVFATPRR
jgi:hypothetical protein